MDKIKHITKTDYRTAIALGFFDGVHKGHQAVINSLCGEGLIRSVLSFNIDTCVPDSKKEVKFITSKTIRDARLECLNVEKLFTPDFSGFKNLPPQKFVEDILINKLQAKELSCGTNFKFGFNAEGNTALLSKLCNKYDIKLNIIEPVTYNGEIISSSNIRTALANGDIKKANNMLGYNYYLDFKVTSGNKIGRLMGVPTVNQVFEKDIATPKKGVYFTKVVCNGREYKGITNIGTRPTANRDSSITAETNIFDFTCTDIKNFAVYLLEFYRDEQKFDGLPSLKEQISKDIKKAIEYFIKNY